MHDAIYASQSTGLDITTLLSIARANGVNESAVSTAISTKKYQPIFDADHTLGTSQGVSGTPAFFINGRMVVGAQPFEAFAQVIDDELGRMAAPAAPATSAPKP